MSLQQQRGSKKEAADMILVLNLLWTKGESCYLGKQSYGIA